MAEKTLNARIVHKHDVEANWLKATNFTPKQGELIVYDKDASHDYERIKIGDGSTNVNSLPFVENALKTELLAEIRKKSDSGHKHVKADITDFAHTHDDIYYTEDEVDGKFRNLVGDKTVSDQISEAISGITAGTTVVKEAEHATSADSATTADTANAVAWTNVTGKPDTYTPAEHTHKYAGSSTAGGAATSANKLNTDAGSATQPVYFEGGIPKATTYTLGKSVPGDAKFTDTTYSVVTTSADGLMSAGDKTTLDNLKTLVGDDSVADQISEALVAITIAEIDAICGGTIQSASEVTF